MKSSRRMVGTNQLASLDPTVYAQLDARRRRALYRSRQRGMLENDLLLGTFASKHLATLTEPQLEEYERILEELDPDLLQWITGKSPLPEDYLESDVMAMILHHVQNNPLEYIST